MAKLFLLHVLGAMLGVAGLGLAIGLWNSNPRELTIRRGFIFLLVISMVMIAIGLALLLE